MRVLLILVDGMRPDSISGIPEAEQLKAESAYTMEAVTVDPSVTLPCHISLFHSVDPSRHGTTTNLYAPQVRPIAGLLEVLRRRNLRSAAFYSWEELRDISRPGSLAKSCFISGTAGIPYDIIDPAVTDAALEHIRSGGSDFIFTYLGWPDIAGHRSGWMSDAYMHAVRSSWRSIAQLLEAAGDSYTVLVTADHGGHDRTHGTLMPEDMTIPVFFRGPDFRPGSTLHGVSIKDLAPTIAALLDAEADPEWEGRSLI